MQYENKISEKVLVEQIARLLVAFPKLEPQMLELLKERFKANNFCDQRIIDAVNYVIDNYTGYDKLPSIADFIRYDKKVKTYTYSELLAKHKDSYYYGAKYDPIANEYIYLKEINRYIKKPYY
ncbi:MAG: hypothetical protein QHH13_07510 [Melioribacter sp.]|nr:hypothetical protein [Melioribacter sp.]